MSDRLKYRLNKEKSVTSVNTDIRLNIQLEQSNSLLPSGDMNRILNVAEQFNKERINSSSYRFITTITSLFTNVLTDITGEDTLKYFDDDKFRKDLDSEEIFDSLEASIKNYLTEVDGWFGYYKPITFGSKLCEFVDIHPKREVLDLTPKSGVKNWDIFLTYPESVDSTHYLVNNGLVIVSTGIGNINGKELKELTTPVKHNLKQGDFVRIDSKDFSILRVGEDNGNNEEYTFVINTPASDSSIDIESRVKKVINGEESTYYIRKFKKITLDNDYEIFPAAFSKTIYKDKINQVVFNEDIDVSKYTDNLGRPLSEVYLTIIKINDNGFTNVDAGLIMPLIGDTISMYGVGDVRRIHNVPTWNQKTHYPIESNIVGGNDTFYGDIVEYNRFRVEEVVLGDIGHRFNRVNRDSNALSNRPEGYFYKPHNKIQIRYWSTFIEQGDKSTEGIPDYAEDLGDGRYLWRGLLDIGFNDGYDKELDYPFLNGCHYKYDNFNFLLRRQDPFNEYNLFYGDSPRDVYGERLDYDKFKINKGKDVC